jgi:integrase
MRLGVRCRRIATGFVFPSTNAIRRVVMKSDLSAVISNGLVCPDGRRKIDHTDGGPGGVPGLFLELRAASPGRATWWLRFKVNSTTKYLKLGTTDERTLTEARKLAREYRARIVLGADPRAEAEARKAVITYAELWESHVLGHLKQRLRSWKRSDELYRLRIKAVFGSKRLNQITRHQVQAFHSGLAAEGLAAATANHHIKVLRSSLNLARQWGMLEGENPAAGIAMLHEDNKIEHYLDEAELQRLLHVLRTDENRAVCRVCLFLVSVGCRLNEALSADWNDISIERRVFTIRATNSKSRKLRSVPLNDSAIEVLNELDTREKGGRLFVGRRGALSTISKVWDRLRKKAELPHLRLHDLRHQFASFLVNDGRTLYEVQQILGHSSSKVTERYAHLSTATLQAASASASARLTGNVVKSPEEGGSHPE